MFNCLCINDLFALQRYKNFWTFLLFSLCFKALSTIYMQVGNFSMVIRFTIHSTIKSPWIHHLYLIAIATLCYILLHHRYMILLTCIIVTYCYSTPLLIDTSFYAILKEKMLFRFCVGFFVLRR